MTGNALIDLAISIAGVALLVVLARLIFGKGGLTVDSAAVADRLNFDEPDFEPVDWLIDEREGAGLARNAVGELALVVAHGDGLVTRRLSAAASAPFYKNGALIVPRSDHTAKEVHFTLPESQATTWLSASA